MNNQSLIKAVLAVFLFLCLLNMPYGFYELTRFISLVGFGILAYQNYRKEKQVEMIFYGALALLFQPFFKISLGRELWNAIDVIVGSGLIISMFIRRK